MATRMQQRRGTASQWTTANPRLGAGEIGFETDTGKFKIGDGVNLWDDLSYFLTLDELGGNLDDYIPLSSRGAVNGVASLDAQGQVPVSQLGNIIDGAPSVLNTLNELAAAIGDDPDFFSEVTALVSDVAELNTAVTGQMQAQATLTTAISNLSTDLGDAETNIQTLSNDLSNLTTSVTNNTTAVTDLNTDLGLLTTTVESHTTNLGTLNTDVADLQTDKAPVDSPTFTGTVSLPSATSIGDVSQAEIAHLNGVTSGIQGQIDAKLDSSVASTTYAPLANATFTGTVVLPNTTSIGTVDSTELSYLNGVTSAIQTQLDAKAPTANPTFTGTVSGVTKAHVGLGNVDNTADADKPVSTATQTALDAKASLSGATFTGSVEIDQNLVVDGNLTVNGTTFNASSTSIVIEDNMVQLAHQNAGNTVDLGIVVGYNDGSAKHAGLVKDATDGTWKLFKGVSTEPTTTVNFSEGSLDNLAVSELSVASVIFSDGVQTKEGVPSITTISQKTDSYTLGALSERDTIIEISKSSGTTLTIPTDASLNFPVGTTLDIIQTGAGQVTIAGAGGVTVNGTPGLKLRTQWSSATLLKRAANTWLVYGDLTA